MRILESLVVSQSSKAFLSLAILIRLGLYSLCSSFSRKARAEFTILKLCYPFCNQRPSMLGTGGIAVSCITGSWVVARRGCPTVATTDAKNQYLSGKGNVNNGLNYLLSSQASHFVAMSCGSVCENAVLCVALGSWSVL